MKHTRPVNFGDVASAARLAHKYSVTSVLNEALKRMQDYFPPTLDLWEANAHLRAPTSSSAATRFLPRTIETDSTTTLCGAGTHV